MASVHITVSRGDGLTVEFEQDDLIMDTRGDRTRSLFDHAVDVVKAGLHGAEPTENIAGGSETGGNRA